MKRISKDEYYLKIADVVLLRSTCLRRRYGAVIVNNDEIVSTGYNGSPRGTPNCSDIGYCERQELNIPAGQQYEKCLSVHGEQNAIISAGRQATQGSTIYIAGREVESGDHANPEPCMLCRRFIKNAGIVRIVGLGTDGNPIDIDKE